MALGNDIVQVRIPKNLARRIDEAIGKSSVLYKKSGEPLEIRLFRDRQHFVRVAVEEQLKHEAAKGKKEAA